MDDLIIYLVLIFFAFWLGWKLRGVLMMYAMSEEPERVIKMLKEVQDINKQQDKPVRTSIEVEPEQVSGYWYAYAKETGQFLGQGPTLEDALKVASVRFPNKTFWCETLATNLTKSIDSLTKHKV